MLRKTSEQYNRIQKPKRWKLLMIRKKLNSIPEDWESQKLQKERPENMEGRKLSKM